MDHILNAVGNFGFPIVVSVFLLVRLEVKLSRVSDSISQLATAVQRLRDYTEVEHDGGTHTR